ncbi:hypothetical protein ACQKII_19460 [Lysinibacillus sp. NPDC048646]|uniref:hypothetical protein n=1 Tax=Lysinibacillus sp. NPDC048646 TaxID=3390574 RepID=UPI003CFF42B6
MKSSMWLVYGRKFFWLIGLILLVMLCSNIEKIIQQTVSETFNFMPVIWSNPIIAVIIGFYISLIIVKKWSFNINPSLLWCVAIPCMLLTFAYPVFASLASIESYQLDIKNPIIINWLLQIYSTDVFGIIAGMTVILSIFSAPKK